MIGELYLKEVLEKFKKDLENFKSTKVKCAIIGRSGTGKSSLINAIAGEEIAEVGEVETTRDVGKPLEYKGLLMYDLPGCSTSNFPKEEYLKQFNINQFDCVILATSDRFYEDDLFLIDELTKIKKPVFATRTKIDFSVDRAKRRGVSENETLVTVYNNMKESLKGYRVKGIYLTSSDFPQEYDLSKLLEDIYGSLSNFKKERFLADINIISEKLLDEKREIAEKIVSRYSALAAANGLNPIPGIDIGVDIALMLKMSKDVQEIYGLTEEQQEYNSQFIDKKHFKAFLSKIAQYGARYGAKEGIMILLKRAGAKVATKTASKWIPFVGQAIAAGIGFKMTSSIGTDMINDAEDIAKEILDSFKNVN